jgi:hypothetical protein
MSALRRGPPPDRGRCIKQRWDVLGGRFIVVVNLKPHVLNEGDILRPILGMEDKVRNFFSLLVNCDGGGGCFGCRQFPPKLIKRPLLFYPNPSLRSVEEAGDSAAPEKNGDKPLPPTGRHITANGNEIINAPAQLGVDESRSNVLQWPDEFYEARAAGSLAKTERRHRCHRRRKNVTISSQRSTYPTYSYVRFLARGGCECETEIFYFFRP